MQATRLKFERAVKRQQHTLTEGDPPQKKLRQIFLNYGDPLLNYALRPLSQLLSRYLN